MLFRMQTLDGIRAGRITVAFRRWKKPTVKSGGTLLTRAGQLGIRSVETIDVNQIRESEAIKAGYQSLDALHEELNKRTAGDLYRIVFERLGPDPRIALREKIPDADELELLAEKLDRLDRASPVGPWTLKALKLIKLKPAVRAGDLAEEMGLERDYFKQNIRKLKKSGLTESLDIGYRLSPRGATVLAFIQSKPLHK